MQVEGRSAQGQKQKRRVSLAVKMNALIISVILIVSFTLMAISRSAYQRTYTPYMDKLSELSVGIIEEKEANVLYMRHVSQYLQMEEYQDLRRRMEDVKDSVLLAEELNRQGNEIAAKFEDPAYAEQR